MPYNRLNELPESVQENLPKPAQEIYKSAFNNAWELYNEAEDRRGDNSREETSHSVAWAAVKHKYEKNEDTGKWRKKREDNSGNGIELAAGIGNLASNGNSNGNGNGSSSKTSASKASASKTTSRESASKSTGKASSSKSGAKSGAKSASKRGGNS